MLTARKRKRRILQFLGGRLCNSVTLCWSAEDRDWDTMATVGREFGSPDYERLMHQDWMETKANLNALVARCQERVQQEVSPSDPDEEADAVNVQIALCELGIDVNVPVAAAVWREYSQSLKAAWMSGADSPTGAKRSLLAHCWPRTLSS